MDDDVELRRLRERVYGVDGASASPETIARLAELEQRGRARDETAASLPEPGEDPAAPDASNAEHPADERPDATPRRSRSALRWALAAVGAVALVGIGIAVGANLPLAPAAADPAAAAYPELTFPQTVEDVISADILRDSGIGASSTRYIATVSDFRIYLAQPDDGDGICIAAFTSSDNRPWSVGCATGGAGPSAFGVDDDLTVAVDDPSSATLSGIPIRLSESVTAYVAQ